MIKKILAAFAVFIMVFSLCACNEQASGGGETTQATASTPAETQAQLLKYPQQMDYAEYLELTPEQQQEYYESFPDQESYMEWFNAAVQEYNQEQGDNTNSQAAGNEVQITQPTQSQQGQTSQQTEKSTQKPTTSPQEEKDPVLLTYEEYLKLTPAQQQAYYESFSTPQAYMAWLNAAMQEYESSDTDKEIEATTYPPTEGDDEGNNQSSLPAIESTNGYDADF